MPMLTSLRPEGFFERNPVSYEGSCFAHFVALSAHSSMESCLCFDGLACEISLYSGLFHGTSKLGTLPRSLRILQVPSARPRFSQMRGNTEDCSVSACAAIGGILPTVNW
nr:hypothetical protein CFP56_09238 [Quercus suber]